MARAACRARLCDTARGLGLAVFQQRHDLRLSKHRAWPTCVRSRRHRVGCRLPCGECRTQRGAADHGRLLHVRPPRGIGRDRPVRRRDVRPRLRRGERFLPACQRARLAASAGLRHLRLSRGIGELRRKRVRGLGARRGGGAGALSALRATGGTACQARRGGAVPLRHHRGAVPRSCSAAPIGRPS